MQFIILRGCKKVTSTKYHYKIFYHIGPDISLIKSGLQKKKRIGSIFERTFHISKYHICPVWFRNVRCIKSKPWPTNKLTWLRNIFSHFLNPSTPGKMTRVESKYFQYAQGTGLIVMFTVITEETLVSKKEKDWSREEGSPWFWKSTCLHRLSLNAAPETTSSLLLVGSCPSYISTFPSVEIHPHVLSTNLTSFHPFSFPQTVLKHFPDFMLFYP